MIDRPLNLFLNREPANDNERIAKAFLRNDVAFSVYSLSDDGYVQGNVFLATEAPDEAILMEIAKALPIDHTSDVDLWEDTLCIDDKFMHGYWVTFKAQEAAE